MPSRTAAPSRPRLHFTASEGWINDPYGVAFVDGRYHLYYQAVPGRVTWAPNCHWGHAVSVDLVQWDEQPLALVPQEFEVGCWSGSVVHADGRRLIFYTRVAGEDLQIGQVATAAPAGDGRWRTTARDVVIDGPPADLAVTSFRDPLVFAHEGAWVMLMGAGLADDTAAVLLYRSTDLTHWVSCGILCSAGTSTAEGSPGGTVWECPQLFRLGDTWVLLVSVLDDDAPQYVAAAVGDFDGRRFEPHSWQRLTYGSSAYAMSAFTDADGRRCVLSWLREEQRPGQTLPERSGAHSVAATVSLSAAGMVMLAPHPHVDARRDEAVAPSPQPDGKLHPIGDVPVELTFAASESLTIGLGEPGRPRATFTVTGDALLVERPGSARARQPVNPSEKVRLLVDADIVEIFAESSYGAFRIPPAHDARLTSLTVDDPARGALQVRPFRTRPRACSMPG